MSSAASVHLTGLPGVEKMLDQYAPGPRQNLERRAVRAGAKPIQAALKALAAGGVPHSFTKVPAAQVSTHGEAGMEIFAIVRPSSPLFNILEPGAKAHTITPGQVGGNSFRPSRPYPTAASASGRRLLAGAAGGSDWPAQHSEPGRKRGAAFFSSKPVRHPGLAGKGLLPRAVAMAGTTAQEVMAEIIFGQAASSVLGGGG